MKIKPPPSRDDTGVGLRLRPPVTDHFRTECLRQGLCENCHVVQVFERKKRLGFFPVKVPLTKFGKVYNGTCLDCHPDRDPDRSVAGSIVTQRQNNSHRNIAGAGSDANADGIAVQDENHTRQAHRSNSNEEKIEEHAGDTPNYNTSRPHVKSRVIHGDNITLSQEEKLEEQAEDRSYDNTYPLTSSGGMEGNVNPLASRKNDMRNSLAESNSSLDTDEPLDALTKLLNRHLDQNPKERQKFDPENENAEIRIQEEGGLVDDQSEVSLGSGFETIATRQKNHRSNLMPISESHASEPAVVPHVAALPAQVMDLRELVEECTREGTDDSAIDIIREELIRDNSDSKNIDLALYCINTLWSLARKSDENKRLIITGNIPSMYDAILEAMRIYLKSADLQARGCGLMWSLSMVRSNRTHVATFEGCNAILQAMNLHQENESLQAMAIRTLKVLSFDSVGKTVLCSWGAPMSVAEAMHMHINNPSIQSEGSMILGNLAVDEESQTVLPVSEREIDAIIRGMLEHPDSLAVHEAA